MLETECEPHLSLGLGYVDLNVRPSYRFAPLLWDGLHIYIMQGLKHMRWLRR